MLVTILSDDNICVENTIYISKNPKPTKLSLGLFLMWYCPNCFSRDNDPILLRTIYIKDNYNIRHIDYEPSAN